MLSRMDRSGCSPSRNVIKLAEERLQRSPYMTVRNVSCRCEGGVLVLRGRLPSFYHKQLAQEAVAELQGITEVVNETEVVPTLA